MKVVICDNERMTTEYLNTLLQKKENIEILGIFTSQVEFLQMMEHRKILDAVLSGQEQKVRCIRGNGRRGDKVCGGE